MQSRAELLEEWKFDGTSPELDLIALAKHLGIQLLGVEAPDDFNAQIRYVQEQDTFEIDVNIKQPATRQRFSVAHELAHYILHRDEIKRYGVITRSVSDSALSAEEEKKADKQAAELLIPEELLRKNLESLGIDSSKAVPPNVYTSLAGLYRVSTVAMIQRIRDVGYYIPYVQYA